ncbi:iron-siderophore ABC transporter substrate-binding protein [Tsukamurella sp. 8F]|uniref:iron-siderophore ABC transporter substrate-binding protein n=1 Tax=unclassified Tsukamurella TaxID=2633480 RepID=UPI0023B8D588|nr:MULTISPECIES: iron-siderophore ABC transporter substrate-binding protein [unclassified Tsukamurella]MDF0530528.1 iron-siderophore ABC transporter substrate-binding protein [Tsukamurella sp. 8J]MDF0586822.1 iron-siderophore ABC transporter substrate-binding protein [Tsukamurella sp. 8F]
MHTGSCGTLDTPTTRRTLFHGAGLVGLAAIAAACGSRDAQAPNSGGRTVEHLRGVTRVPDDPQRIVTVGYSDQDPVLALGGKVVGVTDWYGDYRYATWPWAQKALGDQKPEVLNKGQFTGTPDYRYEEIAALRPDLILGLYTSMSQDQYDRLSQIAPTVGPPKGYRSFTVPWDVATRTTGDAIGRSDEARRQIASVEDRIGQAKSAHPEFHGRTAVVVERFQQGSVWVRAQGDPRSRLLSGLGFTVPDLAARIAKGNDGAALAEEKMGILDQDVLVWNVGSQPSRQGEIEALPIYHTLPAVQRGRSVFISDPLVSAAWTWGTVLSLPTAVDGLTNKLAPALRG